MNFIDAFLTEREDTLKNEGSAKWGKRMAAPLETFNVELLDSGEDDR